METHETQNILERDILQWLRVDRAGKYTTYHSICHRWCLRRRLKEAIFALVSSGRIRKTKSGYRANTAIQPSDKAGG